MGRGWMNAKRTSDEYENGVEDFLQFEKTNAPDSSDGRFYCPCVNCLNERRLEAEEIREHLICEGICKSYTIWICHGELLDRPRVSHREEVDDVDMDDGLEDMIRDIGQESFRRAHVYDTLCSDAEVALYPGCTNFTRLSAVLRLFNVKARNGWSDKSFTELLELLKDMLPEGNTLSSRNYEAKKILCVMGMEYKIIHTCPNDCILYMKEFEEVHECPRCGVSRYKVKDGDSSCDVVTKGPLAKVLWYLQVIPRFKRLFAIVNDAKNIRWHADERKCDGQLHHPADYLQWKRIDSLFPDFGNEPRNLRLGNDIDVYLSPLIEDLRMLWDEHVDVIDGYCRETFKMRAMLFCTINDFPAYRNLCGYRVKGHKACPICEEDTCYHQVQHGRKTVYLGHRRFLRRNHPYCRLRKSFNRLPENEIAPVALIREQVYELVKDINVIYRKTQKRATEKNIWKKRSIFFDLPYWFKLDVRHCIDVMHVEKNVCDSLIGTLLNIQDKTKDGVNARLDLVAIGIREQLAPHKVGGKKTYLPPAVSSILTDVKTLFCTSVSNTSWSNVENTGASMKHGCPSYGMSNSVGLSPYKHN